LQALDLQELQFLNLARLLLKLLQVLLLHLLHMLFELELLLLQFLLLTCQILAQIVYDDILLNDFIGDGTDLFLQLRTFAHSSDQKLSLPHTRLLHLSELSVQSLY